MQRQTSNNTAHNRSNECNGWKKTKLENNKHKNRTDKKEEQTWLYRDCCCVIAKMKECCKRCRERKVCFALFGVKDNMKGDEKTHR